MKLIATRELRYGGRNLVAGDAFDASDKDAKILKAIRKAEAAPTAETDQVAARPAARKPAGRGGQMQFPVKPKAEGAGGEEAAGTYGRRDMRAED
jgi:hypothetical protein